MVGSNQQEIPITNKEFLLVNEEAEKEVSFITAHIPYHEGTHLIGKYTEIDGVEH